MRDIKALENAGHAAGKSGKNASSCPYTCFDEEYLPWKRGWDLGVFVALADSQEECARLRAALEELCKALRRGFAEAYTPRGDRVPFEGGVLHVYPEAWCAAEEALGETAPVEG